MERLIYENDLDMVVEEIEDYIAQCAEDERESYGAELHALRDDFQALAGSGVFQDAIGKAVDVKERNGQLIVIVKTEY